jgi:hypothetical protein
MSIAPNYLENVTSLFENYKSLGEQSIDQIRPNRINWYFHNDTNSIALLVKHMSGNLKSRFTDFLTSDGEKAWRHRDDEFRDDVLDKKSMMRMWEEGWGCLFSALNELKPGDLERTVYIRSEAHTVVEALNRQLSHHAYHVGQIVFLSKMLASEWKTLSIAKGDSQAFNVEKELK